MMQNLLCRFLQTLQTFPNLVQVSFQETVAGPERIKHKKIMLDDLMLVQAYVLSTVVGKIILSLSLANAFLVTENLDAKQSNFGILWQPSAHLFVYNNNNDNYFFLCILLYFIILFCEAIIFTASKLYVANTPLKSKQ